LTPGAACFQLSTCTPAMPFNTPSCTCQIGASVCDERSDGCYSSGGPMPLCGCGSFTPCASGKQCRRCLVGSTCTDGCFDAGQSCTPCW
jgi:hypothetical protein